MATNVIDSNIASRTRSKLKRNLIIEKSNQKFLVDHVEQLWSKLNHALEYAPRYQNKNRAGVDEKTIQQVESKLNNTLPAEIRAAVKVHDGRNHFGWSLNYRLATTDLLSIAQWRPYEKEVDYRDQLFYRLRDTDETRLDKNLYIDVQDHLAVYRYGADQADESSIRQKRNVEYKMASDKMFQALPCELLIIGEGNDNYSEQCLLSIRSGRIYLATHNLPAWELTGTFTDWIHLGIKSAQRNKMTIKEEHDDYFIRNK